MNIGGEPLVKIWCDTWETDRYRVKVHSRGLGGFFIAYRKSDGTRLHTSLDWGELQKNDTIEKACQSADYFLMNR